MRAFRLDRVAAGTALALVLAAYPGVSVADPEDDSIYATVTAAEPASGIEQGFPLPESANLPPPTIADLEVPGAKAEAEKGPSVTGTTGTATAATPDAAPKPAPAISTVTAAIDTEAAIFNAIPMPESAGVPPITVKDIGGTPLGRMAVADIPVGEKLRDLIPPRLDRFFQVKTERGAVEAFYRGRGFVPLFSDNGAPSAQMKAAIARLRAADGDGLDASDYPTPDLRADTLQPDALAEAELKLLNSILTYARHAQSGRVVPGRISANVEFNPPVPEVPPILAKIGEAKDLAKTLGAFNPPHEGYRALKAKLAELRGKKGEHDVVQIPNGPSLNKKGARDPRVPALRERLGITSVANDVYDQELIDAVKAFQKQKGLTANGTLNQATINLLNGRTRGGDVDAVVSNMERWRWLPRELGKAHVIVNVPDFSLKVVHNDNVTYRTRIVVGKPATPSPSFTAKIESIQLNPTWHVPQSIIYNEYLPALQQDPTVLSRMGLVMERTADGSIAIRQPPGERNALGRIKFNFPNRFQVYLHDTPDKNLFNHDRRAYSHGCMRVQNPTQFGEALAAIALPQERYTAQRFQSMFGTGEQWLRFKTPVPVYLLYMNAYVDDARKLVVREDLYGYDARVRTALRGDSLPAVAEKSQVVNSGGQTAGRRGPGGRRVVQDYPQQRGWFPFFFQ